MNPLSRRGALRTLAGGAALHGYRSRMNSRLAAADTASGLKDRINHSVRPWCYPKVSLEDLCQAAREKDLTGVDLVHPTAGRRWRSTD